MTYPRLATIKNCTACLACVASCPQKALYKELDDDGHYIIKCNYDYCVQCRLCEKVCPIINDKNCGCNEQPHSTKAYKGWSLENKYRKRGSSGGAFGIIAYNFILNGGVVVGATLQNNVCKHIVIDSVENISLLQGSKYIYSNMDDIYSEIKGLLQNRKKVLFSGLPCQVAGIVSYFKNNSFKENLYTIDLVCGGIPSLLLQKRFFERHPNSTIKYYRKKHHYVLGYEQNNQMVEDAKHSLLISGFLSGLTNRYSCYDCKFAHAHRISDITLGDYWQKDKENSKGVSLILVHSDRMEKLLALKELYLEEVEWRDFLPFNPKIIKGRIKWENRWERKYLGVLYRKISPYYFDAIYSSKVKRFDIFSYCYLVYKKIRMMIEQKNRKKSVDNFLKTI